MSKSTATSKVSKKAIGTIRLLIVALVFTLTSSISHKGSFKVVPLGIKGGLDESNLSAYLVGGPDKEEYICLDAGTIHAGIQAGIKSGVFRMSAEKVLRNLIKGYFITHPHLDHVSGLIINSPDDTIKNIYGLPSCLEVLKEKHFSWKSWANFADDGEKPYLNKYHYKELKPLEEIAVAGTDLFVTPFELSHVNPYLSTAFLVRRENEYLLYLGDTGADRIEKSEKLEKLWENIGPLISSKKLKAIFIEVSFPNEQPEKLLFGHLTPSLLMEEMKILNKYSNNSLKDFNIIVTHRKPSGNNEERIKQQLEEINALNLNFIYPEQGKLIKF